MAETKVTKKDNFAVLRTLVENSGNEYDYLLDFIDREVEFLDSRAEKAKVRAQEKKEKGNEFREKVYNVLDEKNFKNLRDIVDALDDPEVTKQKVVARLTQLVKLGLVEKEVIKVDKQKITAYKRAAVAA